MNLIVSKSIKDLTSGILKPVGHFNIIRLVKSCSQFNQNNNFLAIFGSLDQRVNDLASLCDTIERHFNRNDRLIFCRFLKELQERLHAFIRIGKQHILLLNLIKQIFFQVQRRAESRTAFLIKQFRFIAKIGLECENKRQIQRRLHINNMIRPDFQETGNFLLCLFIDTAAELHSHRIQPGTTFDQLFHHISVVKIFVIYLCRINIRITRDTHDRFFFHNIF